MYVGTSSDLVLTSSVISMVEPVQIGIFYLFTHAHFFFFYISFAVRLEADTDGTRRGPVEIQSSIGIVRSVQLHVHEKRAWRAVLSLAAPTRPYTANALFADLGPFFRRSFSTYDGQ